MTYTQGPWTIDYAMNDYEGHYLNGAGRLVAITNTVENEVTDEDRANARLIAASPEMLEALQELIDWEGVEANNYNLCPCRDDEITQKEAHEVWTTVFKAIAKATGKEGESNVR